ncbi:MULTISPECIES: TetR/AcrR family transcriptional regulator [Hyphomicrobiales]|uniref:AcrR family transcriptional regulator n=1 Tax=Pseudochelatococcus contaminans TaxID=1538103 RepID=A0A7W5Z619_9HYPH|nr:MULTISPECIES: TetR/AcrR family transcriptional regulator [Hyphomicrobiales]MBB3810866.1 AcrR family transcriptional regulator [Pseudochelatococcus contaminans]WGG58363.1 TetR/AcrR family transcriptional regulator [Brucella intermedia]
MSEIARKSGGRRQRRDSEELRAALLAAASEVFLEEGFQSASIEAVIEKVGGSKRAIYSHFGGKKELFLALVTDASSKIIDSLPRSDEVSGDFGWTLKTFGMEVSRVLMMPTTLALYRAVIAESARQPDVAETFFLNGPGRVAKRLAEVLNQFEASGVISIADCQRAAERFLGMLRDDVHLRVVLGLQPPPSENELEQSVDQAIEIFLRGIETRGS